MPSSLNLFRKRSADAVLCEATSPIAIRELRLKCRDICKPIMVWDSDHEDETWVLKMKHPYQNPFYLNEPERCQLLFLLEHRCEKLKAFPIGQGLDQKINSLSGDWSFREVYNEETGRYEFSGESIVTLHTNRHRVTMRAEELAPFKRAIRLARHVGGGEDKRHRRVEFHDDGTLGPAENNHY